MSVRVIGGSTGIRGEYKNDVWFELESFLIKEGFPKDEAADARRLIELMAGSRQNELDEKGVLAAVRWAFERIKQQCSLGFFLKGNPQWIANACTEEEPSDPQLKRLRQLILAMWKNPDASVPEETCI